MARSSPDANREASPCTLLARPRKRSLAISGHRTSITLEDAFWDGLKQAAREQNKPLAMLVAEVDAARQSASLSAALRVFVLCYFKGKARNPAEPSS